MSAFTPSTLPGIKFWSTVVTKYSKKVPCLSEHYRSFTWIWLGKWCTSLISDSLLKKYPLKEALKVWICLIVLRKMKRKIFYSVLHDIVSTTFNRKFIHEIFLKHQPIYSRKALRAMFDRLAHASTMRLNTESMDKVRLFACQWTFYLNSIF